MNALTRFITALSTTQFKFVAGRRLHCLGGGVILEVGWCNFGGRGLGIVARTLHDKYVYSIIPLDAHESSRATIPITLT